MEGAPSDEVLSELLEAYFVDVLQDRPGIYESVKILCVVPFMGMRLETLAMLRDLPVDVLALDLVTLKEHGFIRFGSPI